MDGHSTTRVESGFLLVVWVFVRMYVCAYICFMCVHVYVEGRGEVRCLNLSLSILLVETGSLTEPDACLFGYTGWLASLRGPPVPAPVLLG